MKQCPNCLRTYAPHLNVCPQDGTALRDASDLTPGTILRGKYEILQKLGEGGMGVVFKARHVRFDEICALKVVSAALAQDNTFVQRFHAEALVMRKLEHPHALRVHDVDETEDGRPFLVMEFVEGQNLATLLRAGPLEPARAVRIVMQLCEALAAAHRLGIIHRDIKPNNILLSRAADGSDFTKLFDFGIAKVKEGSALRGGASLTQTGFLVGTPAYMSPEQARGLRGDKLDGRSDLYSLGVVLYEMLTGRIPFEGDTPLAVLMAHLNESPPELTVFRADLPEALVEIVMTAMAKDPEERFATADAMRASLAQVLAMLTSGATMHVAPTRADETRVWGHEPAPHISPVPTSRVPTPPPAAPRPAPVGASPAPSQAKRSSPPAPPAPVLLTDSAAQAGVNRAPLVIGAVVLIAALGLFALWRPWAATEQESPPAASAPTQTQPAAPAPGPAAKAPQVPDKAISQVSVEKPASAPPQERRLEEPYPQPPAEQSQPTTSATGYTAEEYYEYVRAANERDPATRRRLLEEFLSKNPRSALVPHAQRLLNESAPPVQLRLAGNDPRLKVIYQVPPAYPPLAKQARIGGSVRLQVLFSTEGGVLQVGVIEGHPLLVRAAVDAVQQWRFQPVLHNGTPAEVQTTVDVVFKLDSSGSSNPPAKQDTIILKGSPMGGVKFEHQNHLDRMGAGAAKNCETCHHASKPEKVNTSPQQSCQSCHTRQVNPPMKTNAAGAFHKNAMASSGVCVDCHKTENAKGRNAPVKCMDCHKKENT
jgi:serine/threonine-protein kinase